jgi:type II secretory pathway component GspD/PulD (secretin)
MKKLLIVPLSFILGIFSLAYAQQVSNNIRTLLSSEGRVMYGEEPNSIVVTDYPENIQRISEYLDVVDNIPQQVMIEARVIEVKLDKQNSLGVNWQFFADKGGGKIGQYKIASSVDGAGGLQQQIPFLNPSYTPFSTDIADELDPFTFAIFDENINIVLNALSSGLDTTILSAPSVTTVNNREAQIKVVERLPWAEPEVEMSDFGIAITWKINFEEVGIILKATPTINEEGKITMTLTPEVSEKISDYPLTVQQGNTTIPYTVPVIDRRSASTKVVIGTGQTLIIGGLIKDKSGKGQIKVPLLGDMPILGHFFKSETDTVQKTELLIFVSPTIITPEQIAHMGKMEKYGLGKKYMEQKERNEKMLLILEKQQQDKEISLASQMKTLLERQKQLAEESKELQIQLNKEEQGLKTLEETKNSVIQKRKELQKK